MSSAAPTCLRDCDRCFVRVCAVTVAVLASLVLVGWFTGVDRLTDIDDSLTSMKANSALCFLLLSLSLWVPRGGALLTGAALATVAATAAGQIGVVALDIDEMLVRVDEPGPHPGRMATLTMVSLGLLTLSRLLSRPAPRTAQLLACLVLGQAFVALLGYGYGVTSFYSTGRYSTMALLSVISLFLTALVLVVRRPTGPVQHLLHGEDAGAMLLRRMLPVLLVAVPLMGLAVLIGQRAGWYPDEVALSIVVTGSLALLGLTTWKAGRALTDHDEKLLYALSTLSVVNHDLENRVSRRAFELEEERGRSAVLRDRNRIAADLHDHVIQTLFAVALQLQAEARRSDRPEPLVDASTQVDAAIRGLRSTIFELKRAGTAQQLESDLAEIVSCSGHTEAEVQLRTAGKLTAIPDEIAEHVVAAAREGLSNAVKHARARLITLDVDARGEDLVLSVSDDGIGVDPASATSGMRNLRDRAVRLGGTCVWATNETGGATMTWIVPMSIAPGLAAGLVASAADGATDTLPAALAAVCVAVQGGAGSLQRASHSIKAALDADFACVIVGDGAEHVRIVAAAGFPDDRRAIGDVMERRLTASGHAMSTGQVLRLDNVSGVPVPSHVFGSLEFSSGLVVPVVGHDAGVTLVVGRAEGSFTDLEEQQALALASLLPLAIDADLPEVRAAL